MASWVGNGVGTGEETVFVSGARQPGAWSGLLGFLWLISLLSVDRGPLTVRHKGLECLKCLKRLDIVANTVSSFSALGFSLWLERA